MPRKYLFSFLCVLPFILSDCSVRCLNGCGSSSGTYPQKYSLTGCTITDYSVAATIGGVSGFKLIIDSGSTDMAVAGSSCSSCAGISPLYSEATGKNLNQSVSDSYGSGQWSGGLFSDSVVIGEMSSITTTFSSISAQSSFFSTGDCALSSSGTNKDQGILGLAFSPLANSSSGGYLDQLLLAQTQFPNVFATQLCETGGNIWLGGYDSTFMASAIQYTPLVAEHYYSVGMSDIEVGGSSLGLGAAAYGTPIVDTGTSIAQLPTAVYNALTAKLLANANFVSYFGSSFFSSGSCAQIGLTPAQLDANLPSLSLTLNAVSGGSIVITLPATKSYLDMHLLSPTQQAYCSGVAPVSSGSPIIGGSFLRSLVTVFDRANNRVGFAPESGCAN